MLYVLLIFSLAMPVEAKQKRQKQVSVCDAPQSKFIAKNLQDLDLMTKFMRLNEFYPWMQYHCNGIICTAEEYEKLCYLIKQALKKNEDPNLINIGSLN